MLDPRFKMSAAEFYFRHMDLHGCVGFLQNIKQCLGMLFDEYTFLEMEAQDGETSQSQPSNVTARLDFYMFIS